jgi:hypothetical protein
MGFKMKSVASFKNETSVGLNRLPLGSKIQVENFNGEPREFTIVTNDSDASTTIEEAYNNEYIKSISYTKHESNLLSRGFKNYIINGGFDIWQRGTSFAGLAGSEYTVDRFRMDTKATNVSVSRAPGIKGHLYSMLLQFNSSEPCQILQKIESKYLSNKTITFRVTFKSNHNGLARLKLADGSGAVNFLLESPLIATDNTVQTITFTTTLGEISQDSLFASILFSNGDDKVSQVYLYEVQLEEGSIATPFEQRPIGLELSLCQRYYEKSNSNIAMFHYGSSTTSNRTGATVLYKVKKRITPVFTAGSLNNGNGATIVTALANNESIFIANEGVPSTTGISYMTGYEAEAEIY